MDNSFNSIPSSISYKELNALLKHSSSKNQSSIQKSEESFKGENIPSELFSSWQEISKKILKELSQKSTNWIDPKSSESILALGAMEAYLKMALKAYESSEIN